MKTIKSILLSSLIFVSSISHAGLPPTTIKGQLDALKSTTFNFVVPNHQVTKTGDGSLIETGNKDWLKNPNFEAAIDSSDGSLVGWERNALWVSWVNVGSGLQSSGKLGIKLSVSATTYAAGDLVFQSDEITPTTDNVAQNLSGILWIKSANAGYQLCAKRTVSGTSSCTDIVADSTRYIEYKTPIFSGGDSSESYRLGIYHKEARSLASIEDIFVDDGKLGPTSIAMGTIQTDPVAYSPSISGLGAGSATVVAEWHRIGSDITITGRITKDGTAGSGVSSVELSLPSGVIPDVSRVSVFRGPTVFSQYNLSVYTGGLNVIRFTKFNPTATDFTGADFVAGSNIQFSVTFPVQGWTAGARVSDGYDAQNVVTSANLGSNQVVSSTGLTKVNISTVPTNGDTVNGFNAASNRIDIKTSRYYDVHGSIQLDGSSITSGEVYTFYLRINGTTNINASAILAPGILGSASRKGIYLSAGDYVEMYVQSVADTSYTIVGNSNTMLSVTANTGAAYITPTASVVENWNGTAGDAIGTTSALIKFTTKDSSTGGAYNPSTGIFTAPSDGFYTATWGTQINNTTLTTAQRFTTALFKNGSFYRPGSYAWGTGSSIASTSVGAVTGIYLSRGQTLNINAVSDVATTLTGSTAFNFFSVVRTGP